MSDLPDVYVEKRAEEGIVIVVANKKGRAFLNRGFDGRAPRWGKFVGSRSLSLREYRVVTLDIGSAGSAAAMLCAAYDAGLVAMFRCTKYDELHVMGAKERASLWMDAVGECRGRHAESWIAAMSDQPLLSPRDGLRFILIRYDTDAGMAPGVWEVAKELQRHLSWLQHINRAHERDRARVHLSQIQQAERLQHSRSE
jgi:hypothetical protein